MALREVLDLGDEPRDYAIFLRSAWWREAMLVAEIRTELVERVLARGRACANRTASRCKPCRSTSGRVAVLRLRLRAPPPKGATSVHGLSQSQQ